MVDNSDASEGRRWKVQIYTDGGCKPNPGPGGWGAVLLCAKPKMRKEISGADPKTTNNRMELTAVIQALRLLKDACLVTVRTDSQYVKRAFTDGWLDKWQRNGWRTAAKEPVANKDLWLDLVSLRERHEIKWEWLRGHSGHRENERCDDLATMAREKLGRGW